MTPTSPQDTNAVIRPLQYRDLEAIENMVVQASLAEHHSCCADTKHQLQQVRLWYWVLKLLSLFPNPFRYKFTAYVVCKAQNILGTIQVSPFNRTRSTWRVDRVVVDPQVSSLEVGSQLLRYCFETILEARTWLLEVNIHDKALLAVYRRNGFQPLAHMTYWAIAPSMLAELQEREPDLPNLLPVSNADAQLLYQLDTASMPPLVRQVFDRHNTDFKTGFAAALIEGIRQWFSQTEVVSGYVFESQRKAAIGYFQMHLSRNATKPHVAELTVHPAYTWLYPELLAQMARITQDFPTQSLLLTSADYQPEREEYLRQIGAEEAEHTLLMSRSVWHKLRESKSVSLESIPLSEVFQGLQPAQKPVLGRMSWLKSRTFRLPKVSSQNSTPSAPAASRDGESVSGVAFSTARQTSRNAEGQVDYPDIGQQG